jgi:hypothetical protein
VIRDLGDTIQELLEQERRPDSELAQATDRVGSVAGSNSHAAAPNHTAPGQPARITQPLLQLQRLYGNRYVQRMVAQGKEEEGDTEVSPDVEEAIERARGGGQPLDIEVRAQMEPAFGADFGGVRIHTDVEADALNRALNARAFTTGRDIFFRQGDHNPDDLSGQELLAHELTHVVQQTGEVEAKSILGIPGDKYEQEADQMAKQVAAMPKPRSRLQVASGERLPQARHPDGQITSLAQQQPVERKAATPALQMKLSSHQGSPSIQRKAEEEEKESVLPYKLVEEFEHTYKEAEHPFSDLFERVQVWLRSHLPGVRSLERMQEQLLPKAYRKHYPLTELAIAIASCIWECHKRHALELNKTYRYGIWVKFTPSIPLTIHWVSVDLNVGEPPGPFECREETQEELPARAETEEIEEEVTSLGLEEIKEMTRHLNESLDELGGWLKQALKIAKRTKDQEMINLLSDLVEDLDELLDPLQKVLGATGVAVEAGKFIVAWDNAVSKPGDIGAFSGMVSAFGGLIEEAAELVPDLPFDADELLRKVMKGLGEVFKKFPSLATFTKRAQEVRHERPREDFREAMPPLQWPYQE